MSFVSAPNGRGGRITYAGITLPRRYAQVLALAGAGYRQKEMAQLLKIAPSTIKRYRDDLADMGYSAKVKSLSAQVRYLDAKLYYLPMSWRRVEIAKQMGITRKRLYIIQAYIKRKEKEQMECDS